MNCQLEWTSTKFYGKEWNEIASSADNDNGEIVDIAEFDSFTSLKQIL